MSDQDDAKKRAEADKHYLWDRREDALYRAQLSALYHRKRERFLAFWHRSFIAVAIIGGSSAFAEIGGPGGIKIAAAIIAVTSIINLVFGLADGARRHSNLAQQDLGIEARMMRRGERDFTEDDINGWDAEIREIEATEPPTFSALVVACQNQLAQAIGQYDRVQPLTWWRRALMQFVDFRIDSSIRPLSY